MKIKNYTIFNSNETKNWNYLRNNYSYESFCVGDTKKEFLNQLNDFIIDKKLSDDINDILKKNKLKKIISFCSGTCKLEYYIMNQFNMKVEVSDYTDSILRINEFKIFDKAEKIDISKNFKKKFDESDLVILSRIDTEFEDEELISFFNKLRCMGAKRIFVIPAEILNFKTLLIQLKIIFKCIIGLKKPVQWGYIRSKKCFCNIFKYNFKIIKKNSGFYLYV